MQKKEAGSLSHAIYKTTQKWVLYLNFRAKILKLLEENIRVNLHNLNRQTLLIYAMMKKQKRQISNR